MEFVSKKAENCFAEAENYEYRLECNGAEFLIMLDCLAVSSRVNEQLRRPTFASELADGTKVKGILAKPIIKVGYSLDKAPEHKQHFEDWLRSL